MEYEFMITDTPLPPCMLFPKALAGLPISSTAKVMYCKMLDAMLTKKLEDENGILFVYFPVRQLAYGGERLSQRRDEWKNHNPNKDMENRV